ncbi:RNA-binding (RRM/RBD/RNP motifs) family protein [Artemisia annua]|uniref:RNA-binding (RRM/RBD/RNP motifs) family protein n=1 Tax=Artemisia annua TaxID=35608 RepID=A0A2U1KB93_ARTAN|nr:RNA-binding (RRM/RBD/RNP motifs) family protein [Artemisia annua]
MSTTTIPRGWFFKPIIQTSVPMKPNLLKLRACFIEYPLATKLMVRNLSYSTSESSLKEEFSNFGQVAEVKLVKDETSKKSKGYAFVQYTNQDDAISALENMDEKYLDGRVIFVELAKPIKDKKSFYPRTSGPPQDLQFLAQNDAGD